MLFYSINETNMVHMELYANILPGPKTPRNKNGFGYCPKQTVFHRSLFTRRQRFVIQHYISFDLS